MFRYFPSETSGRTVKLDHYPIPEGWEERRLEEVCLEKGQYGANSPKQPYDPMLPRYVRITDIDSAGRLKKEDPVSIDWASAEGHILSDGDILLARSGATVGKSYLHRNVTIPCAFAGYLIRFRPELERLAPEFLAQYLYTPTYWKWVADTQRAQAQPNINAAEYGSLLLPLPPLPEQKKIAAILSSVDELIAKTEAVIAQLQIVKKAMMEQLLTKGMPGRHTRFQTLDTEWRLGRIVPDIGEIPETWRLVHITDVARLESGHTPSRNHPEYWEGDIPWVSLHDSKNLDGPVIMDTAQTIGALGLANSSARMLPKGTVVFSRTATVGKCTVLGRDMSTSQDFANYVCGPTLDPRYLMHLMRNMQTEWKRLMAGSTHQTIYMPVFRDLQILLPPMDEQRQIAAIGDQFHGTIASEYKAVAELKHLKSALSSSLLSGELRVIPEVAE